MNWLQFILGFGAGFVVAVLLALWIWMKHGYKHIYIQHSAPEEIKSIVEFQPYVKWLIATEADEGELYFRTKKPVFLLRMQKLKFKNKPDVIEIDIRSSDENNQHYLAVREGLSQNEIDFKERFTPKQKRPKDMRVRIEVGAFAPAAVANILKIITTSIGCNANEGIYVSERHPSFWSNTA
ncbi:MAG: hypothetical protein JXA50_08640 [Deltaproteobacteria bacterium]|nr:hypothetical protein [Deltaproteobacteria bacterium]